MTPDSGRREISEATLADELHSSPPAGSAERVWNEVGAGVAGLEGADLSTGRNDGGADAADRQEPRQLRRFGRTVAAVAVAAVISLLAAVGVASASTGAMPGDALYSTKRAVENLRLAAATSTETEAGIRLEMAENRLDEASATIGSGQSATAERLITDYSIQMNEVEKSAEKNEKVDAMLTVGLEKSLAKLRELAARHPGHANKGLNRAIEVHERNIARKKAREHGKSGKNSDDRDDKGKGNSGGGSMNDSDGKDGKGGNGQGDGNGGGKGNSGGGSMSDSDGNGGNGKGNGHGNGQGNGSNGQGNNANANGDD